MFIRPINESDNEPLSVILREVLIEMQIPKKGSAYDDPELDNMFLTYQLPRSKYFVVEEEGRILGGAGISPLKEGDED
ncbi:MAG: GNAT family N-acetyltransferase, partial [Cryomorphaceae bacterium]|nr:GNAT family N-acetyltransferase [Cryomorphaceae bacterium]